jgi:hypothetical protein
MRKSVILKTLLNDEVLGGRDLLKGKDLRKREATAQGMVAWYDVFVNRYWKVLFESEEDLPQRAQRTQSGGEEWWWRIGIVVGGAIDSEREERIRGEAGVLPSLGAAVLRPYAEWVVSLEVNSASEHTQERLWSYNRWSR